MGYFVKSASKIVANSLNSFDIRTVERFSDEVVQIDQCTSGGRLGAKFQLMLTVTSGRTYQRSGSK